MAALTQILHGIILNAWRKECGYPSLSSFAKSDPSAAELLALAEIILLEHACPISEGNFTKNKDTSEDSQAQPNPDDDIARQNILLLTHVLLNVIEIIKAIATGDIGRVEDMLGNLAMMFRGAGSNNYSGEILHWLHNMKKVWGTEFA